MGRNWQTMREQDQNDIRTMAMTNSSALHYCTMTKHCGDPLNCTLCMESARLAVQHYRPIIEKRVVGTLMDAYDVRCRLPHPGGDD